MPLYKVITMSKPNQVQMTIRLSAELAEQITQRARLHHRSRTAEIQILLEDAIDAQVARDLEVFKSLPDQP